MRALFFCAPLSDCSLFCCETVCRRGAAGGCLFVTLLPVCRVTFIPGNHRQCFRLLNYLHHFRFYLKPVIPFGLHDGGTPFLNLLLGRNSLFHCFIFFSILNIFLPETNSPSWDFFLSLFFFFSLTFFLEAAFTQTGVQGALYFNYNIFIISL